MFWILQEHYHKRKDMKKGFSIVVGIIVIVMIILCLLAINANHSWIEFSTIFNGIMMPILTAINVYVFVKLTNAVSEKDEMRSRKELEYQKNMMLMQFRKSEIDAFSRIITNENDVRTEKLLSSALLYVDTFYSSRLSLFNLNKESGVAEEIFDFCKCLANCYNKAIENKSVEEDDVLQLISKKNNIVCALQDITLSMK